MPTKGELRGELRGVRRARTPEQRSLASGRLLDVVLGLPELVDVATVAAYVSSPTEPATGPLLDALAGRGLRVLLPVLLPDLDLDWAVYTGSDALTPTSVPGRGGLLEPIGPRLGVEAIGSAGLVLVPALAVGPDGCRLGQGGGSYDRALARVPLEIPVAALLFDGELLDDVPGEPHDRAVSLAILPSGVVRIVR